MINHDRLFKELLTVFLFEFLELFLPELAHHIEPETIEFLDKEMFTELGEGDRREADLVARARFRGKDSFFLIHAEAQADSKNIKLFPRRMFRYYSVLLERHDLPIYPIALLSFSTPRSRAPSTFRVRFPDFEPLRFRFRTVQLNRLEWRDFVRRPNPVAAALMSRMHIDKEDRPAAKVACLRLLAGLNLDRARSMFLSSFIDQYLRLDSEEQRRFNEEVEEMTIGEKQAILELTTSWEEQGLQRGLKQGLQRGLEQGRRLTVLEILEHRFGQIPAELRTHIEALGAQELTELARYVHAETLEDLTARVRSMLG